MSALEEQLCLQMRAAKLPAPEREFSFCAGIGWRFDLALLTAKLAFEVEGGTWISGGGRHQRGQGFENDCRKYNTAQLLGWQIYRFTRTQIESGEALTVIEAALGRRDPQELIDRIKAETKARRSAGARLGHAIRRAKREQQ